MVVHNSPADENPGSFNFIVHSLYNTVECVFWGGGGGGGGGGYILNHCVLLSRHLGDIC